MGFSRLVVENGIDAPERVVLRLRGEFDMVGRPACAQLVSTVQQTRPLAVDLAELDFIDSRFLALDEAHSAAQATGSRVVLVSPSATISRIVELMGFDNLEASDDRSPVDDRAAADGTS